MGYKSDIEIAQECRMLPITEIAKKAGIAEDLFDLSYRSPLFNRNDIHSRCQDVYRFDLIKLLLGDEANTEHSFDLIHHSLVPAFPIEDVARHVLPPKRSAI